MAQPLALIGLLALPVLAIAHVRLSARRRRHAARFTNVELLRLVLPRRPGWRRNLVALLLLGSVATMVLALAQPQRTATISRRDARIMLVVDISPSMLATDVAPSRLDAAKAAATSFIEQVPDSFAVGLTSFAGTARVLSPPTTDHALVRRALNALEVESETAIGDGIVASLHAVGIDETGTGATPPAHILLLSDGAQTAGVDVADAIHASREAHVPVSTIAFGTEEGTVTLGDETVPVPPDVATLAEIARETGGQAFAATTAAELEAVYDTIGTGLAHVTVARDLTRPFVAFAAALLLTSATLSARWLGRLA